MIRSFSFTQAVPFANELASRGLKLAAIPGSLLSELVKHSFASGPSFSCKTENMANMIEYYTSDFNMGNIHPHGQALGNNVDSISGLVLRHISYTKNVVKPLVQELATKLQADKEALRGGNKQSNFAIVSLYIPELLKDSSFLDTLKGCRGKAIPDVKGSLRLKPKVNDDVRALMITGSTRHDDKIGLWLSRQEPNFAVEVWETFVADQQAVSGGIYLHAMDNYKRLDYLLGGYLLLSRILSDVQETTLSSSAYENLVSDLIHKTGVELCITLEQIYDGIKFENMIVEGNLHKEYIKVDGELYDQWVATGGVPEVILGILVSNDKTVRSVTVINEKSEIYKQKWNSFLMFLNTQNSNSFYSRFKQLLIANFAKQLVDQTESEVKINVTQSERITQITKDASDYIDSLSEEEMDDVHCIALILVAKIRFCHTSSYQILCDMGAAMKANPNIDVREAALLASINYLGDFLGDQVTIIK